MNNCLHGGVYMNDVELRVLKLINMKEMIDYLSELLSIPSYGGRETEAQESILSKLQEYGMTIDSWKIDFQVLKNHPKFSMSIDREEGLGVVGTLGNERGGRNLILNGHIDTVAPGDEKNWNHPPLKGKLYRDRMYGRGTSDMKGGLCCGIFAARAIAEAGVELKGRLQVQSVIGEEDGGVGALATVLRGYKADGAIVMEPTDLKISPVHSGAAAFNIKVPGRSAHACVREEGISAIEKFIYLFESLKKLEKKRNIGIKDPLYGNYNTPFPINIGTVNGGNWPGSVPETLTFQGRIGVLIEEKAEEARKSVEDTIARASEADPWLKDHQPTVEWSGYQFDPARTPTNQPIVETVRHAYSDATNSPSKLEGMTYASDMRHLVNLAKIPTVLFGPGDVRRAHGPDEYVELKELDVVTQTLALTALRYCGYEK
jgi:acetylornithine deacetylase